jgi:hypothetical protein
MGHAQQKIQLLAPRTVHVDDVRAFVEAEYHRIGKAIGNGVLRGAGIQWSEGAARVVVIENDPWCPKCDANIKHKCGREVRMICTEVVGREFDMRGDPIERAQDWAAERERELAKYGCTVLPLPQKEGQ